MEHSFVKNNEVKSKAADELQQHVLLNSRELSNDDYIEFLHNINLALFDMIQSGTANDRVGALMAIEKLLEVDGEENTTRIVRYGDYLNIALNANDEQTVFWASKVLGSLVSSGVGATLTAEFVDDEIRKALINMQLSDRNEMKRYGGVLVIKELMQHVSTSMYPHLPSILDAIWRPLRDMRSFVKEAATNVLEIAFTMVSQREETQENQYFLKMYTTALQFSNASSVEYIQASLLTLRALLSHAGRFMDFRLKDVCDLLLQFKSHKDPEIRWILCQLIPMVAAYNPSAFEPFIARFMNFLLSQIKKEKDPSIAFVSVGQVALAIESGIKVYIDDIIKCIMDSLGSTGKLYADKGVCKCIGMLAKATGPALTKYLHPILDLLFKKPFTRPLIDAMKEISTYIPPMLPALQERLLNALSYLLCQQPFTPLGAPKRQKKPIVLPEHRDPELLVLALETLGSFDFGQSLSEFASDVITLYLDEDHPSIRLAASLTCCRIFMKDPSRSQFSQYALLRVQMLLERLLTVAVADPDHHIRFSVLQSLDSQFDEHLAKAENIHSIFLALSDEVFANREVAMKLVGKVSLINPAHTLPVLRKLLIQLLTEFEYINNNKKREECARLLAHLIEACRYLIKPYVEPILRILLPKIKEGVSGVTTSTLTAISCLASVSRENLLPHLNEIIPKLIDCLFDPSSQAQLLATLKSLGQIASSTGYVIQPYMDYPQLLDIIFSILKTETTNLIRMETLTLLGTLGALDPYLHNQINHQSTHSVIHLNPMDPEALLISGIGPSHEDYYPSVAINATIKICLDNTLSIHHAAAVKTICNIVRTLGSKSVTFLPHILPTFLSMMKVCSTSLLDCFFQELVLLVQIVGIHMSSYLSCILSIIEQRSKGIEVIAMDLIEALALSLESDFKAYLPILLPHIIHVFELDKSPGHQSTKKALDILCILGAGLEDYLYLVLPSLMQVIEKSSTEMSVRIYGIKSIAYLFQCVNVSIHASSVIHPLVRCLIVSSLRINVMEALTALLVQMGSEFLIFVPMIQKAYLKHNASFPMYEIFLSKLLNQEPLPPFSVEYPGSAKRTVVSQPEVSQKFNTSVEILNHSWETSLRSTKDDWTEWFRRLSVEFLKESPSPSLRTCSHLASVHAPLARQLFNASFVSCWNELSEECQHELVQSIINAFMSPHISPDIVQLLLKLAEFMEHDEKPLPIDNSTLSSIANKHQAYAKALHYEELEFMSNPCTSTVGSLISINNHLQLPDAAIGVLTFSQLKHQIKLKESWYLQLQRWEDGLIAYERRALESPHDFDVTLGALQCLQQLGESERISQLVKEHWLLYDAKERSLLAPFAATAEWGLGHWEQMDMYVQALKPETLEGAFFRAILAVRRNIFPEAQKYIHRSRVFLDMDSASLVAEGYTRSYNTVVHVQMLAELEEVIQYKKNTDFAERQHMIRRVWKKRLLGMQKSVEVWDQILKVRSVVLSPQEDSEMWIKFSSLCRKGGRFGLSQKILESILGFSPNDIDLLKGEPNVVYAYLKHLWDTKHTEKALSQLILFTRVLSDEQKVLSVVSTSTLHPNLKLLARCHLKLGDWQLQLNEHWQKNQIIRTDIINTFEKATHLDPKWYKAWHSLSLAHFQVVSYFEQLLATKIEEDVAKSTKESIIEYVILALRGFAHSISLSKPGDSLQDTLRMLTLWFKYGYLKSVSVTMIEAKSTFSIDIWLQVIPQLIARIHSPSSKIRAFLHQLLCDVSKEHSQALIYPLLVASKSPSKVRTLSALQILDKMRVHSPELVKQGLLVSQELIRIAILWEEMWHEALEEASRQYFGEKNICNMLSIVEPLHRLIAAGPETVKEIAFHQAYGRDLEEAFERCQKYSNSKEEENLNQAWDLYFQVFRKINKQLPQLTTLELQYVSPALLEAKDLELAVPGTYRPGAPVVHIRNFVSQLQVISSKQRPRRLTIYGDDGKEYHYLLKGHEDLRQDERVMQLFGLVNQLLENDPETYKRHLDIQRYSVIPLSPNSGLLGWVPHCDTMHSLIREFRESRKILLNVEHRLMLQMAPDYDHLSLLQKIEVFEFALENTNGQDLSKVLWLKSQNSEAWIDRRTNYTRSLAVMSMVGYILGLGDRHPSNLMIDRFSGKVVHIDFGDCFEVAMIRDKFPEKIPFRLTRMLINAMEVSGIEGSFRITCEHVMRVLRENKESLMAVLEAFVYDPLIDWRIMNKISSSEGTGYFLFL
ncbi:phosphatidylinositol kinase- protein kinase tor1 [Coelomomyces lativittatus]|nr:phosphatidylinositol kinase- protein kinase tor1 [Coelomomyces lativittatus]